MTNPFVLVSPGDLSTLVSNAVQAATKPLEVQIEALQRVIAEKADEPMTTERVAEMLDCDVQTVIRYHKEEGLQGERRGRGYRFMRSHVMAFLTSQSGAKLAQELRRRGAERRGLRSTQMI